MLLNEMKKIRPIRLSLLDSKHQINVKIHLGNLELKITQIDLFKSSKKLKEVTLEHTPKKKSSL